MSRKIFWLVIIIIIIFRFTAVNHTYSDGEVIDLSGQVLTDPLKTSKTQTVVLKNLKVVLASEPEIHYGDYIDLRGIYKDKQIYAQSFQITPSEFVLFKLRLRLLGFFEKNLPQPHASLVAGEVLGAKRQVDYDFLQRLRTTGTSHIVVASGMNVVIIAFFFLDIFMLFLNRKHALIAGIASVWIYVIIAGFEAPLIRAAVMSTFTLGAKRMGRLTATVRILLITAAVMLIYNPFWLLDLGFQLSFLATLSLILFEAKIRTKLSFVPAIIRSDLSTTLAAQIGVAPLLFLTFGYVSLISPLVNTLILWTVPIVSVGEMIAGIVGIIFEPLGRIILLMLYPFTWWFVHVIYFFS